KPIRFGKRWRRGKIATLCAAMMVLAVVGAAIWTHHGYPNRWVVNAFETQNAEAFRRLKEVRERVPTDITNADHQSFRARYGWKNSFPQNPGLAMFRNVNGKHTTLLLGDSHAFHAYYAIADDNAAHGINTVRMGESWMFYKGTPEYVEGLRDFYFNAIKSDKSINKIFIMTFTINGVLSQSDIDALQQDGVSIYLVEDNPLIADPGTLNNNQLQEQCNRFLKTHHPLSAALFGNDHEVDEQSLPILNRSRADATKNYQAYLDVLRSRKNVTIIEGTLDAFCNETTCPFFDEQGMPLFWDDNHITVYTGGHRLIEKVLKPYLD
ncbi:MAG: hypothetical protein LBG61_04470, partial [Burkholderiales bacterium]|nr:hypothetical protein [Burkholderiales bacterium]